MNFEPSTYLMHRVGAIIGLAGVCLFFAFLTENQPTLSGSLGKAYYFWAFGLIVAIAPLIMVLPRRGSMVFLLLALPFFGVCGAVALVLPQEVLPHVWIILGLGFVLALMSLTKSRKFRFLDLQPKVSPHMFAESLAILGTSWVCASALQILEALPGLAGSSPIAANLFWWATIFGVLSMIAILVHVTRYKHADAREESARLDGLGRD